jgi:hypothetical protein
MSVRWYRKLADTLVLQRLCHDGKWRDVEEASEYDELKHKYGKYDPDPSKRNQDQ